jgi:hypothetical protein
MTIKTTINFARVISGGCIAGIILFIGSGIVNGAILNSEFEQWVHEMGNLIHPLPQSTSLLLWGLMCLMHGIVGVWIYAGIRPRYGAGPKTALLAGLLLWIVSKLAVALDLFALGILPKNILVGQLIESFVAILLGVFLGALFYKE